MDFKSLTTKEIVQTLLAENAKALSEIRHAQDDLEKAESRLKFNLALIHNLNTRDLKD
jgi:hypothetical protein